MGFSDKELIKLGARFSTQRMAEQIPVSVATARKYKPALGPKFPPAKVDELEALGNSIEAGSKTQTEKKFEANTGNVPVAEKMDAVKEGVRDIITTADNAFEEEPEIRDQFHKHGPLGRTVTSTMKKAETIIVLAKKNSAALAEWGLLAEEIAATETALSELKTAEVSQETALTNLPPSTAELYRNKGRAYLLLKQLNRTGKRRLSKQPAAAKEFNLDILNRKGTRKNGEGPEPGTTP
jgi:hypothetical protein